MSTIHSQFAQHLGKKILYDNKEYIVSGVWMTHVEGIDYYSEKHALPIDDCRIVVKTLDSIKIEKYSIELCVIKYNRKYVPAIQKEFEEKEEKVVDKLIECSGITRNELFKKEHKRLKKRVWARQIHIAVRMLVLDSSSTNAAKAYDQNHATAIWAKKQVLNLIETDKEWMNIYKPAFDVIVNEFGYKAVKRLGLEKHYPDVKKVARDIVGEEKVS